MHRLIAIALAACALGARADVDKDDPRARQEALRELHEEDPSAQALQHKLAVARAERTRAVGPRATGTFSPIAGTWINLGPTRADLAYNGDIYHAIDSGRARRIVPHPADPQLLYFATSSGGIWKTYDGGASWEPITDFNVGSLSVGALALDPQDPDVLVLGLGDPFDNPQPGLLRSVDGGATWSTPAFATASYGGQPVAATSTRDLAVDPQNSAHILAATDVGLFSWDGAHAPVQLALPARAGAGAPVQTWSVAWAGGANWLATGQELDLSGAAPNGLGDLWRSTDGGLTWTLALGALPAADVSDVARCTLAPAPGTLGDAATARIYLLCAAAPGKGTASQKDVYRSEDGGQTFAALHVNAHRPPLNPNGHTPDLNVLREQAFYNQAIAVDPRDPDTLFVGGELSIIRSRDGGQTWSIESDWLPIDGVAEAYVHADVHAFAFGPAGAFYAGTDGGLFTSTDARTAAPGAMHFSDALNVGIVAHLAYSIACAAEDWPSQLQGFVIGGTQDNGTRLRTSSSSSAASTFDQVLGGDGIGVAVSRSATASGPTVMLASTEFAVYRSTAGGAARTWEDVSPQLGGTGNLPFLVRFATDPSAPDKQTFLTFSKTGFLYRSIGGATWSLLQGPVHYPDGSVQNIFVDVRKAASKFGFHFIATHPTVSGHYAVDGSAGSVFLSSDAGASWTATAPLGTNGARALAIKGSSELAFDPSDPSGNTLWVGSTDTHVFDPANPDAPGTTPPAGYGHLFKTTDGGRNWSSVTGSAGAALPDVGVEAVAFDPADPRVVYVGTQVGLYQTSDGGATFTRAPGMPLVEVTDICVAPGGANVKVATYGRGFWQLDAQAGGAQAGARGRGDMDFNQRIDGFDLLDAAAALGSTNSSPAYRPEADLVGAVNAVDDADLSALLARFGGTP